MVAICTELLTLRYRNTVFIQVACLRENFLPLAWSCRGSWVSKLFSGAAQEDPLSWLVGECCSLHPNCCTLGSSICISAIFSDFIIACRLQPVTRAIWPSLEMVMANWKSVIVSKLSFELVTHLELFMTGDTSSASLFRGASYDIDVLLSLTLIHCIVDLWVISLMMIVASLPRSVCRLYLSLLSLLVQVHDLAVIRYG